MTAKQVTYFDKPGPRNTEALAQAVRERCQELGIRHVVAASGTGATALALWDALHDLDVTIVAVPSHAGFRGGDSCSLSEENREALEEKGIHIVVAGHALSGIARSVNRKFGTISHVEIIAQTLKLFGCEGIKVGVEVAVMAADAGLVPTDREIVAVGGTGRGGDTAIVVKAAHMNNFFDLEVREVIAKPRQRPRKAD